MQKPKHSKYYEGVLQLRNPSNGVLDFVKKQVDIKPDVFISRIDEVKNGIDLYISSKKYILQLGKMLRTRFGGEIKTSAEHYSRDRVTSKDLYRVNVVYRYPGFKKGETVKYNDTDIKVIHLGKKVIGINPVTGKKQIYKYEELKKIN